MNRPSKGIIVAKCTVAGFILGLITLGIFKVLTYPDNPTFEGSGGYHMIFVAMVGMIYIPIVTMIGLIYGFTSAKNQDYLYKCKRAVVNLQCIFDADDEHVLHLKNGKKYSGYVDSFRGDKIIWEYNDKEPCQLIKLIDVDKVQYFINGKDKFVSVGV